jgi:hypothetical protein
MTYKRLRGLVDALLGRSPDWPVISGTSQEGHAALNLNYNDIPIPEMQLWEQFDEDQKRAVIETPVRLLVKATDRHREQIND